ncbi:MAG: DNA-binding response regulator [Deltaproteobacteria bacterium]|mgnify:CR=1 FL=1|nr:response regulator transcription factor [Deltaproteobacteria bacterium]MBW2312300.1 response regulator transcription factor [Deltaproteobacteria bacterium]RLB27296.1 MAG: DNA-binding response regulator [Deltaproteobacteria bacterium]
MRNTITVVLADDHRIFRKGLKSLLSDKAHIEVLAEADNGDEALKKVGQHKPHLVIMDIGMPKMDGIEATRQIKERFPKTEVVILSMHAKKAYIDQVLKAGAKGYVLKDSDEDNLIAAINTVHNGGYYLDSPIADQVLSGYFGGKTKRELQEQADPLSEREKEVLRLLAEGHSNQEVADILCISRKTVENHRANIVRKTGVQGQVGLTKYAARIGLIDLDLWE